MSEIFRPEVLAPVGDSERLEAAVLFGADAVYLGSKMFGMRASSQNFDFDELKNAVGFAHASGVKVYLTCNTLPTNEEIDELPDFIKNATLAGVDAMIVADVGILMMIKRLAPNMEVHISTQAGIVNHLTANELYHLGASRVVLARELSLEEIKVIRDKTPPKLDIEAFVHGAMCMAFSGRCLLSKYMVDRDANRGECAQPCRWKYHLVEEKRPGQLFEIQQDQDGAHIMNAKDLCMIEHIDKVVGAGVTSLKIEGRAKSAYYVSVITNAYRCAVDSYLSNQSQPFKVESWIEEETRKISHRQYSTGFFFGKIENGQNHENGGYVRSWDVVAIVQNCDGTYIECIAKNRFCVGDEVEILSPKQKPQTIIISEIIDCDGQAVDVACHPMRAYKIKSEKQAIKGSIIRAMRKE